MYKVVGSNKAGIEYDSEGSPLAMCYNGTQYVYLKNAQGDIMGLRSEANGKIILYRYDEWGRMTGLLNEDGSMVETEEPAALFNPLRFRGYVYDDETGWYYLNSRYYDPMACRYLNADAYVSTGQGLTGNNMFAYCGNNSPLFKDPSGMRNVMVGSTGGCNYNKPIKKPNAPISGNKPAPAPRTKYSDELDVLNGKTDTYKGAKVVWQSKDDGSSFTIFNTLHLNEKIKQYDLKSQVNTVRHEYGHTIQEKMYGEGTYIGLIAVPSAYSCVVNQYDEEQYYSQPWEYSADILGGAERNSYLEGTAERADEYFSKIRYFDLQ